MRSISIFKIIYNSFTCFFKASIQDVVYTREYFFIFLAAVKLCLFVDDDLNKAIGKIKKRKLGSKIEPPSLDRITKYCSIHADIDCLVRSLLISYFYIGIVNDLKLYIGIKRFGDSIIAHAWVSMKGKIVDSSGYYHSYKVIRTFDFA